MNKKRKLVERFLAEPADFSWAELEKLLKQLGRVPKVSVGAKIKIIVQKLRMV